MTSGASTIRGSTRCARRSTACSQGTSRTPRCSRTATPISSRPTPASRGWSRESSPELLAAPASLPRLLLHPDGLAPRILNLDEWGWHVVDAVTRSAARNANPTLEALAGELAELVPERSHDPPPLGVAVPLRLRDGDGELRLLTTLAHFATATDVALSELTLEAFLPGDAETAERLRR